jgi:hypothetical protein
LTVSASFRIALIISIQGRRDLLQNSGLPISFLKAQQKIFLSYTNVLHIFIRVTTRKIWLRVITTSEGKPIDADMHKSFFRDFHDRMWNGEIDLAGNDKKLQYVWVHKEEFLRKTQTKRFEDSLHIVSGHNKFH